MIRVLRIRVMIAVQTADLEVCITYPHFCYWEPTPISCVEPAGGMVCIKGFTDRSLPCKPTDAAQNGGLSYLSVRVFLPFNALLSLLRYIEFFDDIGWFTFFLSDLSAHKNSASDV
jgi:hypothetical protein